MPARQRARDSRAGPALANLRRERDKLLELYDAEQVSADYFGETERRLTDKIATIEAEHANDEAERTQRTMLAGAFERAAQLLRDPASEFEAISDHASDRERRVMIEELIEAITIQKDYLEVTVAGAPPLLVTLADVGLRDPGTEPVVPEG